MKTENLPGGVELEGNTLKVEDNAQIDQPIKYFLEKPGDYKVKVGKGAKCRIIEELAPDEESEMNILIEIGGNSNVKFTSISMKGEKSDIMREVNVARDGSVNTLYVTLNDQEQERITRTKGHGAEADEKEIFFGTGTQEFKVSTTAMNAAPHTNMNVLIHGILTDKSKASYKGNMSIQPDCPKSNSKLSEHVLLLSPHAKADMIPSMEVETDDVTAYHAATVSPVNPEHIFYLKSRGLDEASARELLVLSFLNPVLEELEEGFKNRIMNNVKEKINHELRAEH